MNRKGPDEEGWATWLLTQGPDRLLLMGSPYMPCALSTGISEAQPHPLRDSWQNNVLHPLAGVSILISEVGGTQIYLETSLLPAGISKTHVIHQYRHWYLNHWGCEVIAAGGEDLVKEH